ncbi:MAG: hypothetical protein U5J78_03810 [Parasphingorhabdus sp.]|nr:hypothetical protein [Parasphingorhabdus sp.]
MPEAEIVKRLVRMALDILAQGRVIRPDVVDGLVPGERLHLQPARAAPF